MGGDSTVWFWRWYSSKFQSTPPLWVVTSSLVEKLPTYFYFNPHHPCGWWRLRFVTLTAVNSISIHTTLVGGDLVLSLKPFASSISIHTTLVGGDLLVNITTLDVFQFQSTPPLWVVTDELNEVAKKLPISIHTTLVGGDTVTLSLFVAKFISIHTTLVGGDFLCYRLHQL